MTARILVKREYDEHGTPLPDPPPEQVFADNVCAADVHHFINAAQTLLLNPSTAQAAQQADAKAFAPTVNGGNCTPSEAFRSAFGVVDPDYGHQLAFTRNIVVVAVTGADVDLSVIDLPGIVQSHEKGEQYADMTKDMVRHFIGQDHVQIVMAISGMDDVENQVRGRAGIWIYDWMYDVDV